MRRIRLVRVEWLLFLHFVCVDQQRSVFCAGAVHVYSVYRFSRMVPLPIEEDWLVPQFDRCFELVWQCDQSPGYLEPFNIGFYRGDDRGLDLVVPARGEGTL